MKATDSDPLAALIFFLFSKGKEEMQMEPLRQSRALEMLRRLIFENKTTDKLNYKENDNV